MSIEENHMSDQTSEASKVTEEAEVVKLKRDAYQLSEILRRIDQRQAQLKLSDRAVSLAAGLSASQIRTMRRQHRIGLQHGASIRTIAHLAEALRTTPEWLISGTGQKGVAAQAPQSTGSAPWLRLAGAVGAGLWIEATSENNDPQFVPVPADPRYPAQYQSAYEVRGTSTDRFARPGDFLMVVDRAAAALPVRSGDIVIVTRNKDGLREVTARRFQGSAPNCELRFESTDPRYAGPPLLVRDSDQADMVLGGIAVAVYRPLILMASTQAFLQV
jgi:hypothetical protein